MSDRDMFYNSYGFQGAIPMNPMMPQYGMQYNPQYGNYNNYNDIDNRFKILDQQISKLNQRVTRLEKTNNSNIYSEPDNNIYML